MPLKLRPIGLGSGIDKDYGLRRRVRGGRIYETRGGPESLRWFWSPSDPVATFEEAKAEFQNYWDEWRA